MKMKAKTLVAFTAITVASGALVGPTAAEEFSHRVECRKTDSRGCTADNTGCKTAESNHMFINVKMIGGQGWKPETVRCSKSESDARSVPATVTLPGGSTTTVDVTGYTQVCVNSHAESGSGLANLNKVAWANCTVSYDLMRYR